MVIEEFKDCHNRTWQVSKNPISLYVVKPRGLNSINHPDYRIFKTYSAVKAFKAYMTVSV